MSWSLSFTVPIFHSLKDMVLHSGACLYGHINWSLTQAEQQSSMGSSQSFLCLRGGKARPKTGFYFNVERILVSESSCASLAEASLGEVWLRLIKVAGSLLVVVSLPILLTLEEGESVRLVFLMGYSPQPHHPFHLLLCSLVHFPNF